MEKPLEEEGIISALVNQVSARKRSPSPGPGPAAPLALKHEAGELGGWFKQEDPSSDPQHLSMVRGARETAAPRRDRTAKAHWPASLAEMVGSRPHERDPVQKIRSES